MSDSSLSPRAFLAKIFYRVYLRGANGAIKFPRCYFARSSTRSHESLASTSSLSSFTKQLRSNNSLQPRRHQRFRILNAEDGGVFRRSRLSRFLLLSQEVSYCARRRS